MGTVTRADAAAHSAEAAPAHDARRLRAFVAAKGAVAMHQLPEAGEVTIGRDPACALVVDDPSVAPRHAALLLGPPVRIADLGSGRATTLRQHPVEQGRPVEVVPGDLIHVGEVILMLEGRGTAPPRRILPHGYFELRLEEECHRAARYHSTFGLLRISCEACPPPIIEQVLANSLRLVDVVAADGPEYEVLLIDTPPRDAALVVSRLEAQLQEAGGQPRVGIAVYPRDGRGPDALLARAGGRTLAPVPPPPEPIPASGAMLDIYRMVERIAWSDISVLILGETGVGKERLAEAVHRSSRRAALPFLRLNCAALTDTLLESELFGHERGAFTGAQGVKQGLIESANGGSVFLDEVGEMPMTTQVKLLRVLEERKVRRVGALKSTPIDVRFVAATNRDLEGEVARGTFRKDLYFRLNGVSLIIPPLRDRTEEIEGLARILIAEACRRMGRRTPPGLTPEVLELLRQYPWPGNIRELRNVLERAALLCTGDLIEKAHLPLEKMSGHFAARRPTPATTQVEPDGFGEAADDQLRAQLVESERRRIVEALARCAGNQTKAAKALGISRRTLVKRLSDFDLPRPRKR